MSGCATGGASARPAWPCSWWTRTATCRSTFGPFPRNVWIPVWTISRAPARRLRLRGLSCCPSTFGGERPPQTWCISCRATEAWLSSIATTEAGCLAVSRISQSKLKQDRTVLHMCSRVLVLHTAIRAGSGRGQASARAQTVGGGFVLPVFRVHQPAVLLNSRTLERNPLVTVHAVFSKQLVESQRSQQQVSIPSAGLAKRSDY